MTGGSDVFLGVENLHARYFFGSRDLSRIFLGLKKIRVFFFLVLSPSELFVSGFRCDQWIRKIFIRTFFQRRVFRVLVFFWVGNFDARYFFGSKISGLCIFLGLQYEAPSDPPPPRHVYFEYPGVSPTAILPPGEGPGGQVSLLVLTIGLQTIPLTVGHCSLVSSPLRPLLPDVEFTSFPVLNFAITTMMKNFRSR